MTIIVETLDLGGTGPRVVVKDTIDVAGTATRASSQALEDAPLAERHADDKAAYTDAKAPFILKVLAAL